MSWQDDAISTIRGHGWWKNDGTGDGTIPGRRVCLITSVTRPVPEVTAALRESVLRLFPARARECSSGGRVSLVRFNDHPDTAQADVERVIREAR